MSAFLYTIIWLWILATCSAGSDDDVFSGVDLEGRQMKSDNELHTSLCQEPCVDYAPQLPHFHSDTPDHDADSLLLDVYPDLNISLVNDLVKQGRRRAEQLFGTLIADEEFDDEDISKREMTKKPSLKPVEYPVVDNTSAAAGLGRYGAMSERVVPFSQRANVLLDVTQGLIRDERAHSVDEINGFTLRQFPLTCPVPKEKPQVSLEKPFAPTSLPPCARNKYRTMDGTCNNIAFPFRGKESTVYRRLLPAAYGDGISTSRLASDGQILPGARLVSLSVFDNLEAPGTNVSALSVHFGQFLAHEFISSPSSKTSSNQIPKCCNTFQTTHPDCWPIDIPPSDTFSAQHGRSCMEFVRTLPGVRPGCTLGPREQIDQVTHFIDGSAIYGSTDKEMADLRLFSQGQLKTVRPLPQSNQFMLLPPDPSGCPVQPVGLQCFKSGDARSNVQPGLTMMHTLFMRHHNNLAGTLAAINPSWNDEKLFQETRRIVAAQLQHIVYTEYLPIVLGDFLLKNFDIAAKNGIPTSYDITSDPGITSEFAVAGFRLHSTIPPVIALRNPDHTKAGSKLLRNSFFNPFDFYDSQYFTKCAAGMTSAVWDKMDSHFTKESQNHLFQTSPDVIGLDLPAIDIQRGRDHGLQPYVKYRKLCKLRVPKDFLDLKSMKIMPDDVVARLALAYRSVDDVDLFVGGTVENYVPGAQIGPTFACIVGEQFHRSQIADRFWYNNEVSLPSTFTPQQAAEIRKTSFAKIICLNVDGMATIQPLAFRIPDGESNQRRACSAVSEPTWNAWTG